MDSHLFCVSLLDTINTTWNQDSELIPELKTQPLGYGKTINTIEPNKSQERVVSVQRNLTETTNIEYDSSRSCILRILYP